jgi:hypothetical protein
MRFLAPNGDGMVAEIAEHRRPELMSIRHLGWIAGGVEDLSSDDVKSWAPAYENYSFVERGDRTELQVSVDVTPEYERQMAEMFPKALAVLKELCERSTRPSGI